MDEEPEEPNQKQRLDKNPGLLPPGPEFLHFREDYTLNPPATNQLPASAAAKASCPQDAPGTVIAASIVTYQVLTSSQAKCPTVPRPLRKPLLLPPIFR